MTLYVCENDAKVHSYNHLRGVYTMREHLKYLFI